jgi:hypothetical protein
LVKCRLSGKDGYTDEVFLNQHVGIRHEELAGLFNQIAKYGNIAILGKSSEPLLRAAKSDAQSSMSLIKSMISPAGCEVMKERGDGGTRVSFGDDINSLFNVLQMAKSDPTLEITEFSISHIGYDKSNGLIDEIKYSTK